MFPLVLTLAFILVFSLFGIKDLSRFSNDSFLAQLDRHHFELEKEKEFERAESLLHDIKFIEGEAVDPQPKRKKNTEVKKREKVRSVYLQIDEGRPPNNSRLNFFLLLHRQEERNDLYEIFATLIRNLYGRAPFYYNHLEYHLLDTLIEQKQETSRFSTPDELATLFLSKKHLQAPFYEMLRGKPGHYPSLLSFTTFDSKLTPNGKKVNFAFVSKEVLLAIVKDEKKVEELLLKRDKIMSRLFEEERKREALHKEECLTRTDASNIIKSFFEESDYKKYFDCTLGRKGNILFVLDQDTGVIFREKVALS